MQIFISETPITGGIEAIWERLGVDKNLLDKYTDIAALDIVEEVSDGHDLDGLHDLTETIEDGLILGVLKPGMSKLLHSSEAEH